ncbi:class I SAM-dependent methyltransferase [Ktedonosporobacter rubrisoli]|uniref:Class I SAM-dependent methyltransferase n=1 Tax=Ktedonosporobacter rubrisoli TaxID=2509675 RepID=A0A4P6JKM0_KTERU|nr:class I SAM-dependent methyltransferase [Ktedonosporobacter rubrisoli]QBD75530.1 class I SAM-dependent methyltransferase [Ktedonosporobacter rubrisoli]
MTYSQEKSGEQPNTYFVQDRSNEQELERLRIQDKMVTAGMGGVLPEQSDPARFHRVLDVGCGTGGWLIEMAQTYPNLKRLVGVGISKNMLDYARGQAVELQLGERVEFQVMDALRMLEFPNASFDLLNQRFGMSYLRTWEWPKLLSEFRRVLRPGGIARLTEGDIMIESSSSASLKLAQLLQQAFYQSGHFFTPEPDGVSSQLVRLLSQYGFKDVQMQVYELHYRAETPEGRDFIEDAKRGSRTLAPFIRKWVGVVEDYEELYQQMLVEIQQADFVATLKLLSAWGTKM